MASDQESFTFTVGKLDAGMAILIGERAHLIEFPSLLLPPGVTSGSIVNIAVYRNADEEHRQKQEFWDLQEAIVKTYGKEVPEAPQVEVRNVTQTSVTLEWPPLKLATAKLRGLDIYRNGQRLAAVPSPLTNTTSRLSGLSLQTQYTFQLVLRTTAGTLPSNVIKVTTHSINDTSGISVCFGNVQDAVLLERSKMCLKEMGAKWSDRIQIDTSHFVCTTPAALTPASASAASGPGVEYQRALQASIPIVQPQWIIACYSEKKMVPISGYYLGASPSAPVSSPPFARPTSDHSGSVGSAGSPSRRESLPSVGSALAHHNGPDRGPTPSPETLARRGGIKEDEEVVRNEDAAGHPPAHAPETHEGTANGHSRAAEGEDIVRSMSPSGRPRNGTMNKEFKFPSPVQDKSFPLPVPTPSNAASASTAVEGESTTAALTAKPDPEPSISTVPAKLPELPEEPPKEELHADAPQDIPIYEGHATGPELLISPPSVEDGNELMKQVKVPGNSNEDEDDIGDVVEVDLT
ncbi:hypothetical protein DACRYDRAFT_113291 [Dacryopinax primogenitus]|uniref:Fibronectin type III/BRCA1 domain-containing protein n=1 Tax=Dacryopinax primogenitus (strain DJM 731) TaxID=1858805 RepID=M5GFW3_DACPD|nr:uncharacterized protein DACRYDRAFT_113291 [Dacryopinax primogenitus]EJU06632.1 hypothetical protein DACRYDRAFT_113291 [Dacryopinax primogenitus]